MTDYSDRSKQLAEELAAKAARNLQRSGKTVHRSSTGRFIIKNDPSTQPRPTQTTNPATAPS